MSNYRDITVCIKQPKVIAEISVCGVLNFVVTDDMDWNKPNQEQIINLKKLFNIDVRMCNNENN